MKIRSQWVVTPGKQTNTHREVETRTECHSRWRNSLLQCLWSQPASKRHSHAVTAINLHLTSSQQAAYHVEMLCLLKLLIYAPSVYLLKSRLLFYGLLLSTAPAVLAQKSQFLISLILVANVITALSCYGKEQVTLYLYLRTTSRTCVGGRRNRSAHTRPVVLQRVRACRPVLKFNFADLRGPLHDNSCIN